MSRVKRDLGGVFRKARMHGRVVAELGAVCWGTLEIGSESEPCVLGLDRDVRLSGGALSGVREARQEVD